jgi:hypothetical protein
MADNLDPKAIANAFAEAVKLRQEAQGTLEALAGQLKYLKNQNTLRSEILAATKKIYEVTRDIEELDREDLGTQKDILRLDKEIEKALRAQKSLQKDLVSLGENNSRLSSDISIGIKEQLENNRKNVAILEKQKELSSQISSNFGTAGFDLLATAVERIGGKANILSKPFRDMAEASRTVIKDAVIQNQKIKERQSILDKIKSGELKANKDNLEGIEIISAKGKRLYGAAAQRALEAGTASVSGVGKATSKFQMGIKGLGAGFASLGPIITKALGPFALIQVAVDAIKFFVGAMFKADSETTKFAKSLGISKDQAKGIREELFKLQDGQDFTYDEISASLTEINNQLGTATDLTQSFGNFGKDLLQTFTKLTARVGLSAEATGNLLKLSLQQGTTLEATYGAVYKTVGQMGLQRGYMEDVNVVAEKVASTAASIRGFFGGSVEALTKAVLRAKYLGVELDEAVSISQGLLDFQGGIQKELEAEVLIQRDINLDKARSRALAGDELGATSAILAELGRIRKVRKLNVLEEKALVEAGGLSYEQYKKILVQQREQAQLRRIAAKAGVDITKTTKSELEAFKGIVEKAKELNLTGEGLNKFYGEQAMKLKGQLSAQEAFNMALDKAKGIFERMVSGGGLSKFADAILDIANKYSAGGMSGLLFGISKQQQLSIAREQFKALQTSYGVKNMVQAQAAFGDKKLTQDQLDAFKAAYDKAFDSDLISQAKLEKRRDEQTFTSGGGISGGSGYAAMAAEPVDDFIIRPGQPALKFRKDEVVVGGTNLFGNSAGTSRIEALLEQLVNTKGSVYIDGARVGDALVMGTYRST